MDQKNKSKTSRNDTLDYASFFLLFYIGKILGENQDIVCIFYIVICKILNYDFLHKYWEKKKKKKSPKCVTYASLVMLRKYIGYFFGQQVNKTNFKVFHIVEIIIPISIQNFFFIFIFKILDFCLYYMVTNTPGQKMPTSRIVQYVAL